MTRGKPSAAQLDLSNELLTLPGEGNFRAEDGVDCRNYGGLYGLPELREIFAPLLNVPVDQLIAGDNASLAIMHDTLVFSLLKGTVDSYAPWVARRRQVPLPGARLRPPLRAVRAVRDRDDPGAAGPDGPDLDEVRELVAEDPAIKGIWVVPTYANPNGAVYTEEVTRDLLEMATAAADFRIFWDNAYAVHHLTDDEIPALDILGLAEEAGNPNRPFLFASTSKITFAGAGVSFFAGSPANVAWYLQHLAKRTIGPDKINHLRHARYLGSSDGVLELMRQHRADPGAEVRAGDRDPGQAAGRARRGHLDQPGRRLLHQPGRARRHRDPGGRAGQGRRHRPDRRGGGVPVRPRPPRPQHPDRPELPVAGGGGHRHRRPGHLRPAGRHREAPRPPLTCRQAPTGPSPGFATGVSARLGASSSRCPAGVANPGALAVGLLARVGCAGAQALRSQP